MSHAQSTALPPQSVQVCNAQRLAQRYGFAVFPVDHPSLPRCRGIRTKQHDPDTCKERGKHPTCIWSQWSTTDVERLAQRHYFGTRGPRNVGIDCDKSSLLVLDEDEPGALARFCADHGVTLTRTFVVRTGKGLHHYYRCEGDEGRVGNLEGAFKGYAINVRGRARPGNKAGGYVVGPGSLHESGVHYEIEDDRDPARVDRWVLDAIGEGDSGSSSSDYWSQYDKHEWRHGPIAIGKRHPAVSSCVGWHRRMGHTPDEMMPALRDLFARMDLSDGKYAFADIVAKARDVFERYDAGYRGDQRRAVPSLDELVQRERLRREARRIVDREERPPVDLPDVATLTKRLALPPQPVRWRIDDWQPVGSRVMLAAQYKAGKTTVAANVVRSLVDGERFLGMHEVRRIDGTVVLLDFEMSQRMLDTWYRELEIQNTDAVIPIALRGQTAAFDILDDDTRQKWVDVLVTHGARYVIWDCVRPVVDALGLDEHNGVGPLLVAFDALLRAAGIADALVVHHMGHGPERSRGDSRLRDWPDAEWRLVREDDDPSSARFVSAYGRDVDVSESRLTLDGRRLYIVGGSRRSTKAERASRAILAWLREQEGAQTARAIEDAVYEPGVRTQKAVREGLARLITAGRVTVTAGPKRAKLHSLTTDLPS